jgi:hypothetical protein
MIKNTLKIAVLAFFVLINSTCKKEEPEKKSDQKKILSFTIEGQIGTTQINSENATITVGVPDTFDLTSAIQKPSIIQ